MPASARPRALRELSGRLASASRADAAAHRRDLRLRAARRRLRRRARQPDAGAPAAASTTGAHASTRPSARRGCRHADGRASSIFAALANTIRTSADCRVSLFHDLLSAFRQDVTAHALRDVGRRARLLPPLGQSGRPAGACASRLRRPGARRAVGRGLHGAAADELLAGPRRSTGAAAASTFRRATWQPAGRARSRSERART